MDEDDADNIADKKTAIFLYKRLIFIALHNYIFVSIIFDNNYH